MRPRVLFGFALLLGDPARTHYLSGIRRCQGKGKRMFESLQERPRGVEGRRPDRDQHESKALSHRGLINV